MTLIRVLISLSKEVKILFYEKEAIKRFLFCFLDVSCNKGYLMEKHLYIDISNIFYRNVHMLAHDLKVCGYGILRHAIVTSVIYNIEKFEPNKVFICCDAPRNWRKK